MDKVFKNKSILELVSLFSLQNKFRKIPSLGIYHLTNFGDVT